MERTIRAEVAPRKVSAIAKYRCLLFVDKLAAGEDIRGDLRHALGWLKIGEFHLRATENFLNETC